MMQKSELMRKLFAMLGSDALEAAITKQKRVARPQPPNQLGTRQSQRRLKDTTSARPTRAHVISRT
jgi:LPS O-antigen subunit length determinant protein (WzzB/FepE family)